MSDERISSITVSSCIFNPDLSYYGTKIRVGFYEGCLKQGKVTFDHGKVVNICIVYEIVRIVNLSKHNSNDNYPILENALFGPVSLTKNADIDKYKYSGYGIGFDKKGSFSFPGGRLGKNVTILGVDMSSSTNIDNAKKDILIFGKGPTQGLEHRLSAEKIYSINFTEHSRKFCLRLYYSGTNNYLFVNVTEIIKFKAKDSEIVATPLCLGNISRDWSVDNVRNTGLNGFVYDFNVDYDAITVDDILYSHNYLMENNDIV